MGGDPALQASSDVVPNTPETAQAKLARLTEEGLRRYLVKDYTSASDLYGEATELQAELNGETATQNAELLYLYGRSLYEVGVNNSDVLGTKVGGAAEASSSSKEKSAAGIGKGDAATAERDRTKQETAEAKARSNNGPADPLAQEPVAKKTLFQFEGDEESNGSDEEEQDDEGGEEGPGKDAEAEEDDFTLAWESLDLARVLFDRQLQEHQSSKDKEEGGSDFAGTRHVRHRLADTHDLLAEISLEHEKFSEAVQDFRSSLSLKQELYPKESGIIAEAHYKLSLALEFAAITRPPGEPSASDVMKEIRYDKAVRHEAAQQMEAAINSAKARVEQEEGLLMSQASGGGSWIGEADHQGERR